MGNNDLKILSKEDVLDMKIMIDEDVIDGKTKKLDEPEIKEYVL